ncbi:MAG: Pseudouridine-5-phosphate glycosidase [Gemmatimonadetes bacterium]|nr:Pseudouridine-5-phosphate glycosidase [Gemmatimonadota bacterium]
MTTLKYSPEIQRAIHERLPIVALESSVIAQGLPIPANRAAAERMMRGVRDAGAVPGITAVVDGAPTIGLSDQELERFLRRDGVRKVSARDLPIAMAQGADGATTVAASLALAGAAGIRVFATGGIGGVHREPAFDESADLPELARQPILVVCAGAKSILDLPATLERLETLGVPVVGYRTSELPGFFTATTGLPLPARAESAGEIAEMFSSHLALGRTQAMLVCQPLPDDVALDSAEVDAAIGRALESARAQGVRGARITPFLLGAVERETGGRSLAVNLALLEANARLAGEVASALANH